MFEHPMDKYPKAPSETTELLMAAFTDFAKQNECDLETLVNAYKSCLNSDGYEIGKYLDANCGWDVDLELVNQLDDLDYIANSYIEKLRKQWLEENKIEPPFLIGTKLDKGTIESIDTFYAGYYLVIPTEPCPHNGKLLIKFENAKPI